MLRIFIFLAVLAFLISAPAVLARNQDKGQKETGRAKIQIEEETAQNQNSTPSATAACDAGANWRNHGAYVSCVARNEPGPHRLGGPGNSVAARSNVGKKGFVPSPIPTPTATPSATPTATPSATPTATPSANATTSGSLEVGIQVEGPLGQVITFLEQILNALKNLIL